MYRSISYVLACHVGPKLSISADQIQARTELTAEEDFSTFIWSNIAEAEQS